MKKLFVSSKYAAPIRESFVPSFHRTVTTQNDGPKKINTVILSDASELLVRSEGSP